MLKPRAIVDEKIEKAFDWGQFKQMMAYLKPHIKTVTFILFIVLIGLISFQLAPKITQVAIDDYINNKDLDMQKRLNGIMWMGLALFGTRIIRAIVIYFRTRMLTKMGHQILYKMRMDLFTHIQKLSFKFYDSRPAGKILVRITNDVNGLGGILQNGIVAVFENLAMLGVILIFMFSMHVGLTLIVLAALPVIAILIFIMQRTIKKKWQKVRMKRANMNAYLHETLSGMKITQAFTREDETKVVFDDQAESVAGSWNDTIRVSSSLWPIIITISTLSTIVVYVLGVGYIDAGTITLGVVAAFISYLGAFWQPILGLVGFYNQILQASASAERIFELLAEEPDIADAKDAKELPVLSGEVSFKNVIFSYGEKKPVLNDVSFDIAPGETIALVGPTGSGKSTVVNLVSRFYDVNGGSVLLDGHDVRDVTLDSLRSQMGIMLQDSFIFSGTIKSNIKYGRLDATDEEVKIAAKAVHAHEFIEKLEKGYDTEVKERGAGMSEGQKQLLSFARVMLAQPKILILDEATSSIDTQTEKLVQLGIERLLSNRTSFVIAHRLSTIRQADRIFVINDGGIAEMGNHDELMELGGIYYKLNVSQYKYLDVV